MVILNGLQIILRREGWKLGRMITKFSPSENEKPGDIRFSSYLDGTFVYVPNLP